MEILGLWMRAESYLPLRIKRGIENNDTLAACSCRKKLAFNNKIENSFNRFCMHKDNMENNPHSTCIRPGNSDEKIRRQTWFALELCFLSCAVLLCNRNLNLTHYGLKINMVEEIVFILCDNIGKNYEKVHWHVQQESLLY